jgi:integrase
MAKRAENKDYEYYARLLDRRGPELSALELIKLKREILKPDILTPSEKKSLHDGKVAVFLRRILDKKTEGIEESKLWIEEKQKKGIIDDELANLLSDYLMIDAPTYIYSSGDTFSYVVRFFDEFIDLLYELGGKKRLGIDCFDKKNLSRTKVAQYLMKKSPKKSEQEKYRKFLMKFRKWLDRSVYSTEIKVFPYFEVREEAKPLIESMEARHGRILTEKEIDAVLGAVVGMKYPSNEYYLILFRILLVTGLRVVHALTIRVHDIMAAARVVEDALGRVFYKIRLWEAVITTKELQSEWIPKVKTPVEYIYLPPDLYELIVGFINKQGFKDDDKVISVTRNGVWRTLKGNGKTVGLRGKVGIPDLTDTCFRNTYASVIYACTGWDADAVMLHGGWREKQTILDHYKGVMDPRKALDYLKKYKIRLTDEYAGKIAAIEEGIKVLSDEEAEREIASLKTEVKELRKERKEIMDIIEVLKKRGLI